MKRLLACLVLAISFVAPVAANFAIFQTYNTASVASTIFQGDTTKSISAITPSITCLQSGTLQTPAFIQCSASGTTATGSSNPYIDLQYVWTDNYQAVSGSAPDSFTLPSPIGTRSSSLQYGPEYVQVFRSAGTYTVTLTVSGCTSGHPTTRYTGGGGSCSGNAITTASTTQTVTVNAFVATNDYFFDASTGNDANVCSSGSPCQHPSRCAALIEGGSNNRCNFNCGQTFDGTVGSGLRLAANATYSHARVQAGGSACPGAAPIIAIASGGNLCMSVLQNGSGGVKSDIVISSINCTLSGTASTSFGAQIAGSNTGGGSVNKVYFDNVSITQTADNATPYEGVSIAEDSATVASVFQGVVLWNVSTTSPVTALHSESGILGGTQLYYSIVGGTQQGSGLNGPQLAHHAYLHCGGHCTVRWMQGAATCSGASCQPTRDNCIKTSYDIADGDGTASTSSFWLITENYCQSVASLGGPGNNTNNPSVTTIDQYIQQQNVLSGIIEGSNPSVGKNVAFRDNWACLTGTTLPSGTSGSLGQIYNGSAASSAEDSVLVSNVYRNLFYTNTAVSTNANLAIQYNQTQPDNWTTAQRVFDNILQNDSSTAVFWDVPATSFNSAGGFIDYNTYWAANNAGNILRNNQTGVSFATWQGLSFDAHGTISTNPNFPSPSTCNFGSWPY